MNYNDNRNLGIYNRILNTGDHHYEDKTQKSFNRLANQFFVFGIGALFTFLLGHFIFVTIAYFLKTYSLQFILRLSLLVVPPLILNIGLFLLTFKANARYGRMIVFGTISLQLTIINLTYISLVYGKDGGAYLFLFITLIIPPLFFYFTSKWFRNLTMILNLGAICFVMVFFEFYGSLIPLPENSAKIIFHLFMGGAAISIVLFLLGQAKITALHEGQLLQEKENIARLVNEVIPRLEKTRSRFSHVVEDSPDIMFSLDGEFQFNDVNKRITDYLHYKPAEVTGKPFFDLIHSESARHLSSQIVRDSLTKMVEESRPMSFIISMADKYNPEPIEMNARFDTVVLNENTVILGSLSRQKELKTLDYLQLERHGFYIDNYLQNAEIISHKLVQHLTRYLNRHKLNEVRVSLREILLNAIEHGNLGITFDLKSEKLLSGNYLDFLKERQRDPLYRDKRVYIFYQLQDHTVTYIVEDEGGGFDYESFLADIDRPNQEALGHGRGIQMTMATFDSVTFNKKGNRVTLVKKLV